MSISSNDGESCRQAGHSEAGARPRGPSRKRLRVYLAAAVVLAGIGLYREPIRHGITGRVLLANAAPHPDAVAGWILAAPDSRRAWLAVWRTDRIVHRQAAARILPRVVPTDHLLSPDIETRLLGAALDPDVAVRMAALGALRDRRHPAHPALAVAQLGDIDPEIRRLGLDHLRWIPPEIGLKPVTELLEDPDPLVLTLSLKLLERWSGEDFDVHLRDAVPQRDPRTGLEEYRESGYQAALAGAARARAWWASQSDRDPFPLGDETSTPARPTRSILPAPDFELPTLDGRPIRLRDFRGRVVLLNFWTTWCTACLGETPTLIELQRRHANQVAILGISLDFTPDSHGHLGGHATVEEAAHAHTCPDDHEPRETARERIRQKIVRTVTARGINYPVLLDEDNRVGGLFNGGELPTTVIVDADGNVRRRFVGARSLPVFEAMVAEAARPPATGPLQTARLTESPR